MADYRRLYRPGGTYFFTVVTADRAPILCTHPSRDILRDVLHQCQLRWPFDLAAIVLLPDPLHTIWTLPDDDEDFSRRWGWIKKTFTQQWLRNGGREQAVSESKERRHRRGVWQPRFWEHLIRDTDDLREHLNYIHYNPVKHGLACCPHAWSYSSFDKWVRRKFYDATWACCCRDARMDRPMFSTLCVDQME